MVVVVRCTSCVRSHLFKGRHEIYLWPCLEFFRNYCPDYLLKYYHLNKWLFSVLFTQSSHHFISDLGNHVKAISIITYFKGSSAANKVVSCRDSTPITVLISKVIWMITGEILMSLNQYFSSYHPNLNINIKFFYIL